MPFDLVLPLLSAVIYVAGALLVKRAAELGAGVWRITCVCNWATAAACVPILALGGNTEPLHLVWQPALVAFLFLLGQLLAVIALRVGDVSIATPVLGLKIVLVAFFTQAFLREAVSVPLWIAALLSSVAIALLNGSGGRAGSRVGLTILISAGAAAGFAAFDVLVQKWSAGWGTGRFLPVMMGFVALYSLPLWLLRAKAATPAQRATFRRVLLGGAACLGVQSAMFVGTISVYGRATAANVLYSSRGLWSVLAVWFVGHWFANREQHLGRRVLAWRVAGAALLLAAILLVLVG